MHYFAKVVRSPTPQCRHPFRLLVALAHNSQAVTAKNALYTSGDLHDLHALAAAYKSACLSLSIPCVTKFNATKMGHDKDSQFAAYCVIFHAPNYK